MKKIGLFNLEPQIINTAMMQVSYYHKLKGDFVNLYDPKKCYNKIYAFSIFDYTDKSKITKNMICGGTGFNIKTKLPPKIEKCNYDYSLYSNCDHSILRFSRGCINNCKFCIVRKKEGFIQPIKPKNLNPNGKYIKILDNSFFDSPKWKEAIKILKSYNQPVEWNGGLNIRTMNKNKCLALKSIKRYKQIKIAWDNPKQNLIKKLKEITQYLKPYTLMCYVLIGFNSTPKEDLYRIEALRKLKIDPFVMVYDKNNIYQNHFARYVNFKAIFKTVSWRNYKNNIKKKN